MIDSVMVTFLSAILAAGVVSSTSAAIPVLLDYTNIESALGANQPVTTHIQVPTDIPFRAKALESYA